MSAPFFDKFVERLDKIDPDRLRSHMRDLVKERSLLEGVLQSIQEGAMLVDGDGRLCYANKAAEKLMGFEFEKMRGKSVSKFVGVDDDAQDDSGKWASYLSRDIELSYPERRVLNLYAVPLEAPGDEVRYTLVVMRDVTEERREQSDEREEAKLDAVKTLAAGVAHEIGNPLNAIGIRLQLLGRELRGEEDHARRERLLGSVGVVQDELKRLDGIIRQFLGALRHGKPNLGPADLGEVIRGTLEVMQVDIENRRIKVTVGGVDSLPKAIIDPEQMKQVFFNLIKNAMEAMPDGGTIKIDASAGTSFVRVDVMDSGVGIPADQLGRIFEPYHTTKSNGTGLGLMIVRRIVQDHGGQIEVASKEGEGTRFRIFVPLAEKRVRKITTEAGREQ